MARLSDYIQQSRLQRLGINIRTVYLDGRGFVERNTNNSRNDNVMRGVRQQKSYLLNGVLKHTVDTFDTRILYTYFVHGTDQDSFHCPNCGATIQENSLLDVCPYCKTYFNIDYDQKSAGAKVSYDYVLKSNRYKVIAFFVALLITTIVMFFFIRTFGRTYNIYDKLKVFGGGLILGAALYFLFYRLDSLIVLGPIKRKKERENQLQKAFWARLAQYGIDQLSFYNDFHYELGRKFYTPQSDIIDYDILDYDNFTDQAVGNQLQVKVRATIRTIHFNNGNFTEKTEQNTFVFGYFPSPTLSLDGDATIIRCQNCGSTIDATAGICQFCGTPNSALIQWRLIN